MRLSLEKFMNIAILYLYFLNFRITYITLMCYPDFMLTQKKICCSLSSSKWFLMDIGFSLVVLRHSKKSTSWAHSSPLPPQFENSISATTEPPSCVNIVNSTRSLLSIIPWTLCAAVSNCTGVRYNFGRLQRGYIWWE